MKWVWSFDGIPVLKGARMGREIRRDVDGNMKYSTNTSNPTVSWVGQQIIIADIGVTPEKSMVVPVPGHIQRVKDMCDLTSVSSSGPGFSCRHCGLQKLEELVCRCCFCLLDYHQGCDERLQLSPGLGTEIKAVAASAGKVLALFPKLFNNDSTWCTFCRQTLFVHDDGVVPVSAEL